MISLDAKQQALGIPVVDEDYIRLETSDINSMANVCRTKLI